MENKLLKDKALDAETKLTVTKINGRIVVEFRHNSGKMVKQRSFQDSYEGRKEAVTFSKTIKNTKDLRKYFGMKESA